MKLVPLSQFDKEGPKSTAPIWGINISDQSVAQVSGEVILAIRQRNGNGEPDPLRLPLTWLPQELTREIPRQRLLASTEFRRAISKNLIGLISEEDAERLLRQSGAKDESLRLQAEIAHIRKAGAPRTIADSGAEISIAPGQGGDDEDEGRNQTVVIDSNRNKSVAKAALAGVEDAEPGITPAFKMWVDRLKLLADSEARNLLKSKSKYKKAELRFVQRELSKPKFPLCHKLITKALGG